MRNMVFSACPWGDGVTSCWKISSVKKMMSLMLSVTASDPAAPTPLRAGHGSGVARVAELPSCSFQPSQRVASRGCADRRDSANPGCTDATVTPASPTRWDNLAVGEFKPNLAVDAVVAAASPTRSATGPPPRPSRARWTRSLKL